MKQEIENVITFLEENEQYGDDWSEEIKVLKNKYNEQANIMEENDNHSETLEDVSWSGWETDSETGEVLWDDKTLAWFDKWGVADEV